MESISFAEFGASASYATGYFQVLSIVTAVILPLKELGSSFYGALFVSG